MDIKPEAKTIKDILASQKQFIIPRFQREYSWDKKNYQEFFTDILKCIEIDKSGKVKSNQYFLGTMLFIGSFIDASDQEIEVIDGQQRLTTITILFSALSDCFRELGEEKLSQIIFKYIMTNDNNGNQIRVLKSKTSYPYFSYFIQDIEKSNYDEFDKVTTEEEKCIFETYKYFKDNLSKNNLLKLYLHIKYTNTERELYLEILKSIRDQVLNSLVVSIISKDKEQASLIFEILNAKGKRLADIDLIKNKIFEKVRDVEPVDMAEVKWNNVKKNLCSKGETIGLATFYRHFWCSKYKKASAKNLYDQFSKTIKTKEACLTFLKEMENESTVYMNIIRPSIESFNNRREYLWLTQSLNILNNYFNITQVRIVLLALFDAKERKIIGMKEFKETILFLEKFHFVFNALMSQKSNKFETTYCKFSNELRKCNTKSEAKQYIRNLLIIPLKNMLPSFDEFKVRFVELNFSKKKKVNNMKTKYVLNKINTYYSQKELFDTCASIEHIIPEGTSEYSTNIGNLILLEEKINNKLGNTNYSNKKEAYLCSSYKEIHDFVEGHCEWTNEMILNRAEELAELYYDKILRLTI